MAVGVDRAAAAGVRMIPGFCHRHAASTVCMRRMISEGAIGEPLLVRNQFWGPILKPLYCEGLWLAVIMMPPERLKLVTAK